MLDRLSFIRDQLRALTPDANWTLSGVDRLDELARILDRNGILDLGKLRVVPVSFDIEASPAGFYPTAGIDSPMEWRDAVLHRVNTYAFDYEGRRIGFMGTPDRADASPGFEVWPIGYGIAWSAVGHGHVGYVVRPNKARNGIEIVPIWESSSDAAEIRGTLRAMGSFLAFVALPLAGLSVGSAVGSALFGSSIAASYPVLVTAAGNAAVAAAINGGDIKSAARNAAIGAVSGGVGTAIGAQVSAFTETPIFGSLASSVARTAIAGGDFKTAVLGVLAREGVNMISIDPGAVDIIEDIAYDYGGGYFDGGGISPMPMEINPDFNPISLYPPTFDGGAGDDAGGGFEYNDAIPWDSWTNLPPGYDPLGIGNGVTLTGDAIPVTGPVSFDWSTLPPGYDPLGIGSGVSIPAGSSSPAYPSSSSNYTPTQIVQGLSDAALRALQLITAFRAMNNPAVQPIARNVSANGSVSVVGSNGLVQTRTAAGAISYRKPPVGVPQATIDGGWIVNNGDGTYTAVTNAGASQTMRYSDTGGLGGNVTIGGTQIPTVALLAGGGLALLMLSRRR